ncbi:uncharacterized protein AAG666_015793 [Megaptera novaeangliae]
MRIVKTQDTRFCGKVWRDSGRTGGACLAFPPADHHGAGTEPSLTVLLLTGSCGLAARRPWNPSQKAGCLRGLAAQGRTARGSAGSVPPPRAFAAARVPNTGARETGPLQVSADVIQVRQGHPGHSRSPSDDGCPYKEREIGTQIQTHSRGHETGGTQPQAEGRQGSPATSRSWRGRKEPPPGASEECGPAHTLALDVWPPEPAENTFQFAGMCHGSPRKLTQQGTPDAGALPLGFAVNSCYVSRARALLAAVLTAGRSSLPLPVGASPALQSPHPGPTAWHSSSAGSLASLSQALTLLSNLTPPRFLKL